MSGLLRTNHCREAGWGLPFSRLPAVRVTVVCQRGHRALPPLLPAPSALLAFDVFVTQVSARIASATCRMLPVDRPLLPSVRVT